MKNVIILGAGRTGSSFLSGLISHKRFYIQKDSISERYSYPDGDYENPELKNLNMKILWDAGYKHPKVVTSEKVDIEAIKKLDRDYDPVYRSFIDKCNNNGPWLWKDPRLCFTIYYWDKFLDKDNIHFIKITRDPYLVFRSHSKKLIKDSFKRIVQTYHRENIAVDKYLSDHQINFLNIDYSELGSISVLSKINNFLGTDIGQEDYNYIRKTSNKKRESDYMFNIRYFFGSVKLGLGNALEVLKEK